MTLRTIVERCDACNKDARYRETSEDSNAYRCTCGCHNNRKETK